MLPINEIFHTIQGEATYAGTPATFIRLQGCPVGCPWCDTKHTWALSEASRVDTLDDTDGTPTWAEMSVPELVQSVEREHVVITGGEPAMHEGVGELAQALLDAGHSVQMETSGTFPIRVPAAVWVTLSPKVGMPGGHVVLEEAWSRANEVKFPVARERDVETFRLLCERHNIKSPWLIPISHTPNNMKICLDACATGHYRLSLQMHKFIGVR